jgi:hypothetical protein
LDIEPESVLCRSQKIREDMKKIVISIAMVCLCAGSAKASDLPGAPLTGGQNVPITTLYDDNPPPAGDPGDYFNDGTYSTYRLDLGVRVVNGYVILLENGPSQDPANWSDVLIFNDPDTIAILTSYNGPEADAAAFWAKYVPSDNAVYIQETGGLYTLYTAGANEYHIDSVVPEPTTMIAGALLLLPFGASTIRILRKRQMA